jgi:hypothetical protein
MATYYAVNAGGNWSAGGTWSVISAKDVTRVGGVTQPTAADDCILDDYSGAVTVDTTTCLCKTAVFTGHTAVFTFTASQKLTASGSVTFAATHTLDGTGTLAFAAAATLTMGGLTFPGSVSLAGTTLTFAADTTVTGSLTSASGTNVLNGTTMHVGGSLTVSCGTASNTLYCNLTINTAGTITFGAVFAFGAKTITYTVGTVDASGCIFYLNSGASFNTGSSVVWGNFRPQASLTVTMLADLYFGAFVPIYGASIVFAGNYDVHCTHFGTTTIFGNLNFTFPAGKTLYISTLMCLSRSKWGATSYKTIFQSSVGSSAFFLVYQGTPANSECIGADFTDVDASSSAQEIKNYNGGTLTRCTNIRNVTLPVIPSSTFCGG